MNFARFEGKGLDEGQIIDLAETVPFFADHRVILLENTGLLRQKRTSWRIIPLPCRTIWC